MRLARAMPWSPRPTGMPRNCWPRTAASWCRFAMPRPSPWQWSDLLRDEPLRHSMRKNAYKLGRDMIWSRVAQLYCRSFEQARHRPQFRVAENRRRSKRSTNSRGQLPELKLDHLFRMSDSTGIFQHASFTCRILPKAIARTTMPARLFCCSCLQKLGQEPARARSAGHHLRRVSESRV